MAATPDPTPDIDFIDVIEEVMSPQNAIMLILAGAVVGAVILYAITQQQKAGRIRSPFGAPDIDPDFEPGTDTIPAVYQS